MNFNEYHLNKSIIQVLNEQYIFESTHVQELCIPKLLKYKDLVVQAQTGTGKTLAFLLPALQNCQVEAGTQALILAPTRELAVQIKSVADGFKKKLNLRIASAYGGERTAAGSNALQNAHIIVATPGRVLDHIRNGRLNLRDLKYLVLDEADQMLYADFYEDMLLLKSKLPKRICVSVFSATIPVVIKQLSKRILMHPEWIKLDERELVVPTIEQIFVHTTKERKLVSLRFLLKATHPFLALIFANTKSDAEMLYQSLIKEYGSMIDILHGELSQTKRKQAVKRMRTLDTHILIATDLFARGMDIPSVTHVFNYSLPSDLDYYVHRVGRTGRMNNEGIAISLITPQDERTYQRLQRKIKTTPIEVYDTKDTDRTRYTEEEWKTLEFKKKK